MPVIAIVLVLVAAVCHAVWNIAAKGVTGDRAAFIWSYVAVSLVWGLPVAIGCLVVTGAPLTPAMLFAPIVSGVLHIAYGFALQTGYARGDLGVVYPVARGAGPLLSMIVAIGVLGERPQPIALAGAIVVLVGVAIVASARERGTSLRAVRTGVMWGAITGATIAGYTLWDSYSVTALGVNPLVYFMLSSLWQLIMLTPSAMRRRDGVARVFREHGTATLIVGVLSPVAYVLVLIAMQMAPVSLVAPLRESSIIAGALAGWLIFHEARPVPRILGACVVAGGIALITMG